MHWPLRLRWVESGICRSAVRVISAAIVDASTTDGDFSPISDLLSLLELLPLSVHESSWMPDGHEKGCTDHHASLKNHEWDLFVGELALETVG